MWIRPRTCTHYIANDSCACEYSFKLTTQGEHIFGLKIHRFELQARRFHPYSILKAFLKSFRLIVLHLIVVLCVLFYWVARGHV
jgi:hypothetical protein